jgi:capsular polysaccharide biosynthesis protein
MYRTMVDNEIIPLVVPPVGSGWQRDALTTLGIGNSLLEVLSDEALVCQGGVLSSLTGPSHAFAPHPAVLAMMREHRPIEEDRRSDKLLVYVSRLDAGQRRLMLNEHDLCSALSDLGFEIVTASQLSVADQISIFRKAKVIVSPHGAALTNLLFAADGHDGPKVVELFQENYLNRCFLKICQGKRLSYQAVINPTNTREVHHHQSQWTADLSLVVRVIKHVLYSL